MTDVAPHESVVIALKVNGAIHEVEVETRWLLSDVLRHGLGLTGTHVGCEHGVCGCCTVLVDGEPARSCLILAVQVEGADVRTVEDLERPGGALHPLQTAFRRHHGLQCGFCTPGFLMTALPMYRDAPSMTDAELREARGGQLCRCTGYVGIVAAVRAAAEIEREEGADDDAGVR
jgi:aerobic carbon-monoxide dehydrogenase small subunit